MIDVRRKDSGAFYTPDDVVRTLVRWAVRRDSERLLDPSCGDGRFLAIHRNSSGVERDPEAAASARKRAPAATVCEEDFFSYAAATNQRFDCAAGNPPFIRYQRFRGSVRSRALDLCSRLGATFSGLTSSWAPFLVATASLLKPGGRMAFVVPAEIGHAPYAVPLLSYLVRTFRRVQVIAIREKLFPQISEDVWILYADGFGKRTNHVSLVQCSEFDPRPLPPRDGDRVSLADWEDWHHRLRPFLLPQEVRELYGRAVRHPRTKRLGELAQVGIGYVTGANDFFHLRPSAAQLAGIPERFLLPAVRNSRSLPPEIVTRRTVDAWLRRDEPVLLLRLGPRERLPASVLKYLDSAVGRLARTSYKCRHRNPWYVVPDVRIPDGFLTYMSGKTPSLVGNAGRCTCTNSVHAVRLTKGVRLAEVRAMWRHPLTRLSCELEGHPLGGGMLKLEPREAARVILSHPTLSLSQREVQRVQDGVATMNRWRHYE